MTFLSRFAGLISANSSHRFDSAADKRRRRRSRRPLLERLEDRQLLALVSYWSGDNTAADSVGTNHGTLINGTGYATGQVGSAFRLDGVDDRIGVADAPTLALTGSISIEAWVKANAYPAEGSGHGLILFRGDDRGGLDPYQLTLGEDGLIKFQISSLSGGAGVQAPLPVGQFVHVAGTLDDATGEMKLYLNGVLVSQSITAERPFGPLDPASNPGVGIGSHGGYPSTPHKFLFNGLIDELKLYDHALTHEDVLASFDATRGSLQPAISISDGSGREGDVSVKYVGNFVERQFGGLDDPHEMIYGPDGHLYVTTLTGNSVLRYDAATGAPLPAAGKSGAEFVSPGGGGLDRARGLSFGPDGNLYVVSKNTNSVLRFDAATGEPLGALVNPGAGGLDGPRGLLFHEGFVYVTSVDANTVASAPDSILRFDAVTGEPAGKSGIPGDAVFIPSGDHGLDNPTAIVFHNGDFYVASTSPSTSNAVLRYAADGTFKDAFVPTGSGGLAGPTDLVFHGGFLYVTSWSNSKVLRYDGSTGAFVDEVASGGGLVRPIGLLFEASGDFLVASGDTDEIRRYRESADAALTVSMAPWPTAVSVDYSTSGGSATAGSDFVAASGTLTFAPGTIHQTILVSTLDDSVYEGNETFLVNLSNPIGAVIGDGQGTVTIVDNEVPPTKFYVVDDAAANKTFEYSADGSAMENYALSGSNSAPRGAASTAAGDKVWVVDANRNVYIYDTSGSLLGSWTAGTLSSSADEQGIATNGTDIWIVDAKSDRVYFYAGAASRTTGSQNAVSFPLASGNKNPKDIVTDGVHLWVVNDSVQDKVFKYTVGGSYVGSWTLDSGAARAPTGITLDPSNPNHLWIVDNVTDWVFQYDNAVGKTSGSLAPSISFPLAVGNTNPQGIADPPSGVSPRNSPSSDTFAQLPALAFLSGPVSQQHSVAADIDDLLDDGGDLTWISVRPSVFTRDSDSAAVDNKGEDFAPLDGTTRRHQDGAEDYDSAIESLIAELSLVAHSIR